MKKLLLIMIFPFFTLSADSNNTKTETETNSTKSDKNSTLSNTEKNLKEQMEREKKYAKEQKFYQGDEYDLKAVEVDPAVLDSIEAIEPDYDFDITDVYRDDI
jgi:hypothetical protein